MIDIIYLFTVKLQCEIKILIMYVILGIYSHTCMHTLFLMVELCNGTMKIEALQW